MILGMTRKGTDVALRDGSSGSRDREPGGCMGRGWEDGGGRVRVRAGLRLEKERVVGVFRSVGGTGRDECVLLGEMRG